MSKFVRMSHVVAGHDMSIGEAFWAKHFGEEAFGGLMDPVVMLDHFHMTRPTFSPHPHAGISAVTYVFEDATGAHVNYDSLGNHGPINPGALHWFAAGRGAVHTEQPEGEGQHVHALQIFVNLPASKKFDAPYAFHVEPHEIPEFKAPGVRVRVVSGSSNGVSNPHSALLPEPFTLLDTFLSRSSAFSHELSRGWNGMIYAVSGSLRIDVGGKVRHLMAGDAVSVALDKDLSESAVPVRFVSDEDCHFVVLSGPALNEPIAKHGPLVMNTREQLEDRISAFQNGEFGRIVMPQPVEQ
ncbi:pirin family protein [Paraburkholderia panacisoli]|uniref:Pirin family protein n=1 Tax=Paraburkholderia panacisoli TaxID=2603818 RepID=A0A5B0G5M1_9BURK|nr:pirin-like C-terminal cupin domain-containing protein [Paraburkholderia panacisoli]KAA0998522.1 pirin family protein [Paraburkholderia panacisoli]